MKSTSRLIVLGCGLGLFAWLMRDALFGSGVFVFRDAAHYYYPLFRFVQQQWAAGRLPLWNPYDNLGQPLAADPTASVFYPGKLIFALPVAYPWAYKLYIMAHLLLAAANAYRLARRWKASPHAAGMCAISYAFCGNVLFGYCNVVFLVGASWLPCALLCADRMLTERRPRFAVLFGVVLALMTLGGDPQMAYNAGLLAAGYALGLWWSDSSLSLGQRTALVVRRARKLARRIGSKKRLKQPSPKENGRTEGLAAPALPRRRWPLPRSRLGLLGLAAAAGLGLSAVQVLPSLELTARSGRGPGRLADRLLCRLEPGTHTEHVYQFSVGPWRLAEFLWPNVSGRQFPVHRRWVEVIPAEGRVWTPSLYMGLLPLVLGLCALRLRSGEVRDRWVSWAVLAAVAAALGWYGPGWLIHEIRLAAGAGPANHWLVGPPFGGLYWVMTLLLPGYAYFRYPAKLLVVAALGLSVLAARGWDRTFQGNSDRVRRLLAGLGGISGCGAIAFLAIRPYWHRWLAGLEPDGLFGPLDTAGAAAELLAAMLQTAALGGLFWWLLGRRRAWPRGAAAAAVLLTAVDLAVANGWMVVCAPARLWEQPSRASAALRADSRGRPYRAFRHPIWMRPQWSLHGSPTRVREAMRWDVDTLFPKHHLFDRVPLCEVHGAMAIHDYRVFLSLADGGPAGGPSPVGGGKAAGGWPGPSPALSLAKYAILPGNESLPGAERLPLDVPDASLWRNPRHLPRAWIVHHVERLEPLSSRGAAGLWERTEAVLYEAGRPRDLRHSAVVECRGAWKTGPRAFADPPPERHAKGLPPQEGPFRRPAESCRLLHEDPLRVEIEAYLDRPGLVVLCDQFYPGWRLQVKTPGRDPSGVPILRTNRVMRGAWLPAGRHRLVYRYRPAGFAWGAAISGLAWLGLLAWPVAVLCWNRGRPRTGPRTCPRTTPRSA